MSRLASFASLLFAAVTFGCGSAADRTTPDSGAPVDAGPAPTYSDLFNRYFAPGTLGHCATAGCHGDPGHTVWHCGPTKDDCYEGMVTVGLIDSAQPSHSALADVHRSPLVWLNPEGGNMPLDAQAADEGAREAIVAWVLAGARND